MNIKLAFISVIKLFQMSRVGECFNLGLTVKYIKSSLKMPIASLQGLMSNLFTA